MENKINLLFAKAKYIEDEELQSHFLNYICVMLSGYVEININQIIKNCKNSNSECFQSISTIQNATWCKIKPILSLINIEDTVKLHKQIIKTDIIDILYRTISTRNDIAHGKHITTLTLNKLKDDFKEIKFFIQKTKDIFECLD